MDAPTLQAAPVPGTAIVGTTTLDALFTSVYGTRSADLTGQVYSWSTGNRIICSFPTPAAAGNYSAIFCSFEARQVAPSTIAQ